MTLRILWVLIELAATVRAGIATWTVVMDVSKGDVAFSIFTVATVELAFIVALLSIGSDASAPISAMLALAFSAGMQYVETLVLDGGVLSVQDKSILRGVIAFAPIAILGLAYIRRLAENTNVAELAESIGKRVGSVRAASLSRSVAEDDGGAPVAVAKMADVEAVASVASAGERSRKCSECGGVFVSNNAKRVTCSDKCRVARSRRLAK